MGLNDKLRATIIATELSVAIRMIASARCALPHSDSRQIEELVAPENDLIRFRNEFMKKEGIG